MALKATLDKNKLTSYKGKPITIGVNAYVKAKDKNGDDDE
jgi:hypothetical protein